MYVFVNAPFYVYGLHGSVTLNFYTELKIDPHHTNAYTYICMYVYV